MSHAELLRFAVIAILAMLFIIARLIARVREQSATIAQLRASIIHTRNQLK